MGERRRSGERRRARRGDAPGAWGDRAVRRVGTRRRARVALAGLGVLLGTQAAEARERARWSYAVAPSIPSCPTSEEARDAVAARLGYDPFVDDASRTVALEVHPLPSKAGAPAGPAGIEGVLDVRGARPGHREIVSERGDCREVVDALAVAAAIAIDPASLAGPVASEPAPPLPSEPPAPSPSTSEAREVRAPHVDPVSDAAARGSSAGGEAPRARVAARAEVVLGELPAVGVGVVVAAGVGARWWSVDVEGEITAPARHFTGSASAAVAASLLTVAVVPCAHVSVFAGCVVGRGGVLRSEGEGVGEPRRAVEPYGTLGARVGVELPVLPDVGGLLVVAHGEMVAPVTRIALRLDDADAWLVPSVAARLAAGVGWRF